MKKTVLASLLSLAVLPAFCFTWPQDDVTSDSLYSYFGQLRGQTINTSLVLKNTSTIKASDDGEVSIVITEHNDSYGWFESTLGNAVILTHDKELSTVYANLEEGTISDEIKVSQEIKKGTVLGTSGNSGWQDGESCLEFKVYDTKAKAAVNPLILLPHVIKEPAIPVGTITMNDKKGISHQMSEKHFPSGVYTLYRTRGELYVPFKTSILINGATVETIDYNMISEHKGILGLNGSVHYNSNQIYPDKTRQLLGTINLIKGHNTISVLITNVIGISSSVTYNIDCY